MRAPVLTLLHTGQTGVERGAHRAARLLDIPIAGVSSFEGRDEFGKLPPDIARALLCCERKGAREAQYATLLLANILIVGVPDVELAPRVTGIKPLVSEANDARILCVVVDPNTDLDAIEPKLREIHEPRIMITGPRYTRWHDGEKLGHSIMRYVALRDILGG